MPNEHAASRVATLLLLAASACSVVACGSSSSDGNGDDTSKNSVTSGAGDSGAASNGQMDAGGSAPVRTDDAGPSSGDDDMATDASVNDAGTADSGTMGSSDAGQLDSGTDATAPASLVGTWVPASADDQTAATFTSLTLGADGSWSESGQTFDEDPALGTWTQPSTITIDPDIGAPPAGMMGPYLELVDNAMGDGQWDYGALTEAADGSTLTMTLYAQRMGMGLRWAKLTVIHLVKGTAPPVGTWKPASTTDQTTAGFATLTVDAGGMWTETGRTDGDTPTFGDFSEPLAIAVDPSLGSPDPTMHGPYFELDETNDNDGTWIYGFTESADRSTLTLNLYARTLGMGLRWANPALTIQLVKN